MLWYRQRWKQGKERRNSDTAQGEGEIKDKNKKTPDLHVLPGEFHFKEKNQELSNIELLNAYQEGH